MKRIFIFACLFILFIPVLHAEDIPALNRPAIHAPLSMLPSRTAVGNFNSAMIFLAYQLVRNCDAPVNSLTSIVTSFPSLDNLNETSGLGRLIAENIVHELQVRNWNLIDMRLLQHILVNENGEFSLSRDSEKVRNTYNATSIVTGTYSIANNSIIINARVLDLVTASVLSTAQAVVPVSGIESLIDFQSSSPRYSMKILEETKDTKGKK